MTITALDYSQLRNIIRKKYKKLSTQEAEDVLHNAYLVAATKSASMLETNFRGTMLSTIYYNLLTSWTKQRRQNNLFHYVITDAVEAQELQSTPYDYLLYKQQVERYLARKESYKLSRKQAKAVLRSDGMVYNSAGKAAKALGVGRSTVSNAINNRWKVRGYTFVYV